MAVRNFLQGEATSYIFLQIRSGAGMDSPKSAWRDQAENPESYAGSLLFRGRRNRFLQRLIVRMLRFVKNLRRGRAFDNSHGIHRQDTTARIGTLPRSFVRSVQTSDARMGSGGNFVSRYPAARLRGRECSDETQAVQSARLMLPVQR